MGSMQVAIARDQFSAIFGNRRGNPDAISVEEEGTVLSALHALQESRGAAPLRPALSILKTTSRRDGLYADLAHIAQGREAQTAAMGIMAACEFGVFEIGRAHV